MTDLMKRLDAALVFENSDDGAGDILKADIKAEIERLTALVETIKAAHSIGFGAGTVTLSYWNNGQARDAHAVLYPIVFPETKEPHNDRT